MRKADKNADNMMTLKEVKHFLKQVNIEVDDTYAEEIFKAGCSEPPIDTHINNNALVRLA